MLPFMKMHGLGNDFVVVDARANKFEVTPALAKGIAHRQFGLGFDQLAVISAGGGQCVRCASHFLQCRWLHLGGLRQCHPMYRALLDGRESKGRAASDHRSR